jgi:lipid II:glycine glycyltransferase (peptidoglycan interpeptide bridge formation enzyme)
VFSTTDPDYFNKYYYIYKNSLERWDSPHRGYSKDFFNDLSHVENLRLWVAEYKSEMIAGMITLYSKEGVFDWLAAALLNDHYKKLYGAVAVQYEVIKHATENNYKYVNMGASLNLDGVKNFKDTWGAEQVKYHSFVYTKTFLRVLLYMRHLFK